MDKDPVVITKDVHDIYMKLAAVSRELNKSSDRLSKEIQIIEDAIKKLNLGIYAETSTNNPNLKVGYGRIGKKWGIFILEVDTKEKMLFNDAPRPYRIIASHFMVELIDALAEVTIATTKRLEKATELAKLYLEGMKENG